MNDLLPKEWNVPQLFRERLGTEAGHQRMMTEAGHLLLVLHKPPTPGVNERHAQFFWRSPDGTWKASGSTESGLKVLQEHFNQFDQVAEKLDKQLDLAIHAEEFFNVLRATTPLLRSMRHAYATLQQARQTFQGVRELIILRDQAYALVRTIELLDADAKHSLDLMIAQRAEEQSQSSQEIAQLSYRLNLLASFFSPMVVLAALFGMSFPQTLSPFDSPLTFIFVLGTGIAFGSYLKIQHSLKPKPRKK